MRKRVKKLPRVPLPVRSVEVHRPAKGAGSYKREKTVPADEIVAALASREYSFRCDWSEADGCWLVSFPQLPGCYAHVSDLARLEDVLQQAKEDWIGTALAYGKPIPEPKGVPYEHQDTPLN